MMYLRLIGIGLLVAGGVWVVVKLLKELVSVAREVKSELGEQDLLHKKQNSSSSDANFSKNSSSKNLQEDVSSHHEDVVEICAKCGHPDGEDHVCKS